MKRVQTDGLQPGQTLECVGEKLVATGKVLCRQAGQVVFLEGAYPGDRVEAEVIEVKPDYAVARTLRILEPGPTRRPSPCALFDRCGGCDWLDLSDQQQLRLELDLAEDAFFRLRRQRDFPVLGPLASPQRLGYRRRAQLKVLDGRIGFYQRGSRQLVPISRCPVLHPSLEALLGPLAQLAPKTPELRGIHLLAGENSVAVALAADTAIHGDVQPIFDQLRPHGVTSLLLQDGTGRSGGTPAIGIRVGRYRYQAPVTCFFQGNASYDELLVSRVVEAVDPHASDAVLELYCGVGLFTLPLAARAGWVLAAEWDRLAAQAAQHNLESAGLEATLWPIAAAEAVAKRPSAQAGLVLADPPRSGLERSVKSMLLQGQAQRLVYLSCNVTTLARDLKDLQPHWIVRQIELLDLFPQTAHVEALAILDRSHAAG